MNLDMAKIAPELKKYGFVETGKNIYVKMMDDRKYVVDFGRHVICRMDDFERVTEDKEDENLAWVKKLCMDSMFNRSGDNVQKEDDKGVQEAGNTTTEERLKIAELKQDYGYDTETAISVMNGVHAACVPSSGNLPTVPRGYVPKLTIQDVKMYVCPKATDQEAYVFLELCKARGLNPFTNEVYLIKYNDKDPASTVVGKETFTRKAEQNMNFAGFEAGVIIQKGDDIVYRPGTFYLPGESLVGGWAKVHRKDKEYPFVSEIPIAEYIQVKNDGTVNKFWKTKPGTMIRKVALCQALREAFPSEFGGLYDRAEISEGEYI